MNKRREKGTVLEGQANDFGYGLLGRNQVEAAIDIFRFNVYLNPELSYCYDSLGEAYMVAGNRELAIQNYEKSVELDPENDNGIEMLMKLRSEEVRAP